MSDVLCPSGGHWRFCLGVFRTFFGGEGGGIGENLGLYGGMWGYLRF